MRAHSHWENLWLHLMDSSKLFSWDRLVMPNCATLPFLEAEVFSSLYLISSYFSVVTWLAWLHRMKAAEILSMHLCWKTTGWKKMACRNWRQAYCQKLSCDPRSTSSPSHTSWGQGLRVGYEDKAAPGAAAPTGQDIKLIGLNPYGSLPTQDIFCNLQCISSDAQVIIIMWNLDSKFSFLNFNVGVLMYAPMHTNITGFGFK